ncbi:MAG: hypothetical protein GTO76_02725, partial [Planctomycetales bacterium]|nr:hypothetical protein [Planctomycetales bacterium]NIN07592.1 hypothetical protein [Planctomycetales bacterium]NIN76714.1 hypothetical protein [Planctomycetales bacterium]NIO33903.1 hypothetical protein [Planctomycetales bacterium]NIO45711.1 hypothetical protein [Planctomycetales bacterium]
PQFDQGINGPPSRWADIVDGAYAADSLLGGSYTVTVTGHDGIPPADAPARGKELFLPYKQTIDFPHEDTTLDIEVPLTK